MAHARSDRKFAVLDREPVESRHRVDVDKMRREREPQCHRRHEALTAGDDAAVVGRYLREHCHRLVHRVRRVIFKSCGFHCSGQYTRKQDFCEFFYGCCVARATEMQRCQ
jgi:hypothetical protein